MTLKKISDLQPAVGFVTNFAASWASWHICSLPYDKWNCFHLSPNKKLSYRRGTTCLRTLLWRSL